MGLLPQIGMFELILLAVIALIVVGPKDLPRLMRGVGRFFHQARTLAAEFWGTFDQMAHEAEMDTLRREIAVLQENNPVTELQAVSQEISASIPTNIQTRKSAHNVEEGNGD